MRRRRPPPTDVRDGSVPCPMSNRLEDVETCLHCARLLEVERGTAGDAPLAVRCRREGAWRDVPATFIS